MKPLAFTVSGTLNTTERACMPQNSHFFQPITLTINTHPTTSLTFGWGFSHSTREEVTTNGRKPNPQDNIRRDRSLSRLLHRRRGRDDESAAVVHGAGSERHDQWFFRHDVGIQLRLRREYHQQEAVCVHDRESWNSQADDPSIYSRISVSLYTQLPVFAAERETIT